MAPIDYRSSLSRYRSYLRAAQKQPLWRASLFIIFSLILVIVLLALALRPTLITISGLVGTIQQQREIDRKLEQKIVTLQQAQQNYQQVQPRLPILDSGLPTSPNLGEWANNVQQMASSSGLELNAINIDSVPMSLASSSGVVNIGFTLTAKGQYNQLKQMLAALENMRRIVTVSEVQIGSGSEGKLSLAIKGFLGFLPYAEEKN